MGVAFLQIMQGDSLAVTYPEVTRFTYSYAIHQFGEMGRIFDPVLKNLTDEEAAARSCEVLDTFLKKIGKWLSLKGLVVTIGCDSPPSITNFPISVAPGEISNGVRKMPMH